MIGKTLGPYRFLTELGKGILGETYLAEQLPLGVRTAIKVIYPKLAASAEFMEKFRHCVAEVSVIKHNSIVRIQKIGIQQETYFLVSDFVPGPRGKPLDLEKALNLALTQGSQLPEKTVWRWARDIVKGLHFAHSREDPLVHGNIKPTNLLLNEEGHVMIADFGLIRALPGGARASPSGPDDVRDFRSPEQREGRPATIRSDIYSVGAVVYYLLTGMNPSVGACPISNLRPGISEIWERLIEKSLSASPYDRYRSVIDMLDDLPAPGARAAHEAARGEGTSSSAAPQPGETPPKAEEQASHAKPVEDTEEAGEGTNLGALPLGSMKLPPRRRRHPWLPGAVAGVLILALGLAGYLVMEGRKPDVPGDGRPVGTGTQAGGGSPGGTTADETPEADQTPPRALPFLMPQNIEDASIRLAGRTDELRWDLSRGSPGIYANRIRVELFHGDLGQEAKAVAAASLPLGTDSVDVETLFSDAQAEEYENHLLGWRVCYAREETPTSATGDPFFDSGFFYLDDRMDLFGADGSETLRLDLPTVCAKSPENVDVLCTTEPEFKWTRLDPPNPRQMVRYRLTLKRLDREDVRVRTFLPDDLRKELPAGGSGTTVDWSAARYTATETLPDDSVWRVTLAAEAYGGNWGTKVPPLSSEPADFCVSLSQRPAPLVTVLEPPDRTIVTRSDSQCALSWEVPAMAREDLLLNVFLRFGRLRPGDTPEWFAEVPIERDQHDEVGKALIRLSDLLEGRVDEGKTAIDMKDDTWYVWSVRARQLGGNERETEPRRIALDLVDAGPEMNVRALIPFDGEEVSSYQVDQATLEILRGDPDLSPIHQQRWMIRFGCEDQPETCTIIPIESERTPYTIEVGRRISRACEESREVMGILSPFQQSWIVCELVCGGSEESAPLEVKQPLARFRLAAASLPELELHVLRVFRGKQDVTEQARDSDGSYLLFRDGSVAWQVPELEGLTSERPVLYRVSLFLGGREDAIVSREEMEGLGGTWQRYAARLIPGAPFEEDAEFLWRLEGRLERFSSWTRLGEIRLRVHDPVLLAPSLPRASPYPTLKREHSVSWEDTGRDSYYAYWLNEDGTVFAGPLEMHDPRRETSEDGVRREAYTTLRDMIAMFPPGLRERLGTDQRYRLLMAAVKLPSPDSRISRLRPDKDRWDALAPGFVLGW